MKNLIYVFSVVVLISCAGAPDFSKVEIGMKRTEVIDLLGKPGTTQVMFGIEWLMYETHIVIIEADTVVNCKTNTEMQEGFEELEGVVDETLKKADEEINKIISE